MLFISDNCRLHVVPWKTHKAYIAAKALCQSCIQFKLAVLVYECLHGTTLSYLADELQCSADSEARRRLRSTSSSSLTVRRTRLSTVGDRAFRVSAARTWNSLRQQPLSPFEDAWRLPSSAAPFLDSLPQLLACLCSDYRHFRTL